MKDCEKMAGLEVHGCPLRAGSCQTIRQFIRTACTECLLEVKRPSGPPFRACKIREKFCALTSREAELCSLIASRLNTAEIATCLHLSPRTVEKHIESIFKKLKVCSREQLRQRLGIRDPAIPPVGTLPAVRHT